MATTDDLLNRMAVAPRISRNLNLKPASPAQSLSDPVEDEQSLTEQAVSAAWNATKAVGSGTLSGLSMIGNLLDLPQSMVRDILVWDNPLDQLLDPLSHSNTGRSATGRDVLARNFLTSWAFTKNKETGMSGWLSDPLEGVQDVLGFAAELALGGLTRTPSALINGAKATKGVPSIAKTAAGSVAEAADDAARASVSTAGDVAAAAGPGIANPTATTGLWNSVKQGIRKTGHILNELDPGTHVGRAIDKHVGGLSDRVRRSLTFGPERKRVAQMLKNTAASNEEADAIMRIAEARATTWAKEQPGRTPDDYFKGFEDIRKSDPSQVGGDALQQNPILSDDFVSSAGKTARPWKTTTAYKNAALLIKPGDKVADYGSGPYQFFRSSVEEKGGTYSPFDRYGNIGSLESIKDADVVVGSNVLNVAAKSDDPLAAYNLALQEMIQSMKPSATLVVNMPSSGPKAEWMSAKRLEQDLRLHFSDVTRKGEVVVAKGHLSSSRKPIDTPEFKSWFGDYLSDPANSSRVVDDKGLPLVVYHGTRSPDLGVEKNIAYNRKLVKNKEDWQKWREAEPDAEVLRKAALNEERTAKRLFEDGVSSVVSNRNRHVSFSPDLYDVSSKESLLKSLFKEASYPERDSMIAKGLMKANGEVGNALSDLDFEKIRDLHSEWRNKEGHRKSINPKPKGENPDWLSLRSEDPIFNTNAHGATDHGWYAAGTYFSDQPGTAGSYAMHSSREGNPGVLPVYLNIRRPFIYGTTKDPVANELILKHLDLQRSLAKRGDLDELARAHAVGNRDGLIEAGYDGVIIKTDEGTEYVAFRPEQIKSVHNKGTFDPANPSILKQNVSSGPKGAIEFLDDNRAIIHAFQSADISTLAHELGHKFRRDIPDSLLQEASQALGVSDPQNWAREHEEAFASGFERYLRDGSAPTSGLARVFEKFKEWMTNIYQSIVGTPLEQQVSPQLRKVFDQMLGGSPAGAGGSSETASQAARMMAANPLDDLLDPHSAAPTSLASPAAGNQVDDPILKMTGTEAPLSSGWRGKLDKLGQLITKYDPGTHVGDAVDKFVGKWADQAGLPAAFDLHVTQKILNSRFGQAYKTWRQSKANQSISVRVPNAGSQGGSYPVHPNVDATAELLILQAGGKAPKGSRILTPSELNMDQDLATRVGEAFGSEVLFFGGTSKIGKAGGVRIPTAGSRVWVNANIPVHEYNNTVGHEMLHLLRDVDNDLFNKVLDIIHMHAPPDHLNMNVEEYRKAYKAAFNRDLKGKSIGLEEGVARTVQKAFDRPAFWDDLMKDPQLSAKVQQTFTEVMDKLKNSGKVSAQEFEVLDKELSTFMFSNRDKMAVGATDASAAFAQSVRYSLPGQVVEGAVPPLGDMLAAPGSKPAWVINSAESLAQRINAGVNAAMNYKVKGRSIPVVQTFAKNATNILESRSADLSLPMVSAAETINDLVDKMNLTTAADRMNAASDLEGSLVRAIEQNSYLGLDPALHPVKKQLELMMSALHEYSIRAGLQMENLWDDYAEYFPHKLHPIVQKKFDDVAAGGAFGTKVGDLVASHKATQSTREDLFRNAYYGRATWNAATTDEGVLQALEDFKAIPDPVGRVKAAGDLLRQKYIDTIDPRIPVMREGEYTLIHRDEQGTLGDTITVSPQELIAAFERVQSNHDLTTTAGRTMEHTHEPMVFLSRKMDEKGQEIVTEFELLTGRVPGDTRYGDVNAVLPDGTADMSKFGYYGKWEEALDRHARLSDWMGRTIGTATLRKSGGAFGGSALNDLERFTQAKSNSCAVAQAMPELLLGCMKKNLIRQTTEDPLVTGKLARVGDIFDDTRWRIIDRNAVYNRLVAMDPTLQSLAIQVKSPKKLAAIFDNMLIDPEVLKEIKELGSYMPGNAGMKFVGDIFGSFSTSWKAGNLTHPGRHFRDLFSGAVKLVYSKLFSNTAAELAESALFGRASESFLHYDAVKNYLDRFNLPHTPENATRAVRVMYGTFMRQSANIYQDVSNVTDQFNDGARGIDAILESMPGDGRSGWGDMLKGAGKTVIRKESELDTTWNPLDLAGVVHAVDKTDNAGNVVAKAGEVRDTTRFAPVVGSNIVGKHTTDFNRLVGFIEGLRRGDSPADAWKKVDWNQINYNPRTFGPFEKSVLKKLFPFYSFMSRESAWLAHELMTNPNGRLGKLIRIIRLRQPNNQFLPQHLSEGIAVPIGGEDESGTQNYLTGLGLMFEDPLRMAGNLLSGQTQDFARDILSDSNPLIKGVAEWGLGRSSFQGGPLGGRDLADMDPVLGRLATQVGLQKERPGGQAAPLFGSRGLEFLASNSPVSRILSSTKTALDERKNILERAMNILTGFRITSVSPEQRQRGIRELTNALAKDIGARPFTTWHISEELLQDAKETDPETYQALLRIKEMRSAIDKQQRIKRNERESESGKPTVTKVRQELNKILKHNGITISKEEKDRRIKKAQSVTEGTDSYYEALMPLDVFTGEPVR